MQPLFEVRPHVAAAISDRRPVVALESTLITHGLPEPVNLETALELEATVNSAGAVPATIGIAAGRVIVGLSEAELRALAVTDEVEKVSRRDLAAVVAGGGHGATTVAATLWAATEVGIRVLATGGIGGVHRGGEESLDVSADLHELGRTRGVVVCSGAKAILDLGRTLEVLETLGVPVLGFGCDRFPAFYSVASAHSVSRRVDSAGEAATLLEAHWALGLETGVVVANPPPADRALDSDEVESWIGEALAAAAAAKVVGAAVTPFLLDRLASRSAGRTVEVNRALLVSNADVAARIATVWSRAGTERQDESIAKGAVE